MTQKKYIESARESIMKQTITLRYVCSHLELSTATVKRFFPPSN